MSSNVLQPNPPHLTLPSHTHTHTHTETPNDTFPQMPFLSATPQKIPHLHHYYYYNYNYNFFFLSLSKRSYLYLHIYIYTSKLCLYFFLIYVGFLGFVLVRVLFSQRKQETKPEPSHLLSLYLSLPLPILHMSLLFLSL